MVFGWFKKDKPAPRIEPPAALAYKMPSKLEFAREAVTSLGYIKPEAVDTITDMISDEIITHPKESVGSYRKTGEQISDDEKKALGIRKNAFLSRRALNDLTDKGRGKPLVSHEITLLRATFCQSRASTIARANAIGVDEFKYSSFGDERCPACSALDGQLVRGADVLVFPPEGCVCETGRYSVNPEIDYLAGLEGEFPTTR